jgi:SAM-dependent methyltransferase
VVTPFHCRACGSTDTAVVLSLGRTPLANALVAPTDAGRSQETFPLTLVRCLHCSLVQIDETVPPDKLFKHYAYFSSFSDTMVAHARSIAERLIRERRLGAESLVVEAASNDGYLLQHYVKAGVPVLGIEPAENIARVANDRGIRTESEFFGRSYAESLAARGEIADIVHANNVLAHVPDLPGFIAGLPLVLKQDGLAVIEAPYLKDLLDRCEFDTIYHEHLSYFSVTALDRLFASQGLTLVHVERLPIHGGSIRVFGAPRPGAPPYDRSSVERLLQEEQRWGAEDPRVYQSFAERVTALKGTLLQMLRRLKGEGRRLAAYGAAAKGATLLNYLGVGNETLEFVADRSTYKQGNLMPGAGLPIVPPARLLEEMPDYVLLLTWNFADEILAQQAEYRSRGGKFIVPIPEPRIV